MNKPYGTCTPSTNFTPIFIFPLQISGKKYLGRGTCSPQSYAYGRCSILRGSGSIRARPRETCGGKIGTETRLLSHHLSSTLPQSFCQTRTPFIYHGRYYHLSNRQPHSIKHLCHEINSQGPAGV